MKAVLLAASVVFGVAAIAGGQMPLDGKLLAQLKRLFPSASSFSSKSGAPPHFTAYATDARGGQAVLGYAFWTTEVEPLERGYDGPIKMLVGLAVNSTLTGVIVTENREPYGYFSVDTPQFANQFAGKAIGDPFRVGSDVDAISRASISVGSATRAIRNSARRVARELLAPAGTPAR